MELITFEKFHEACTGQKPFKWLSKISELFIAGDIRDALIAETGTGKTRLVYAWVHSHYYSNTLGLERFMPMRLWWIVNRKLLVDEAYQEAKRIQQNILKNPALIHMKEVLIKSSCDTMPIRVHKLRGGLEREDKHSWLSSPITPMFISTTVDQYGSRLLLRGYGVPSRQRALNAGMAQSDSLVVFDESQLITPAINTIKTVFNSNPEPIGKIPKSRTLELTATYSGDGAVYNDLPMDDPIILKRRYAKRNISYVKTENCSFNAQVIKEVGNLFKNEEIKVVAVICNTIREAKKAYDKLKNDKYETIMLIGKCRNFEKEKLRKKYFAKLAIGRDRSKDKKLVVVATQTIEVGVNFDFDAMISQSAPIDCIIQRFGRSNREGEFNEKVKGIIIHSPTAEDKIYGKISGETFDYLAEKNVELSSLPLNEIHHLFAPKNHNATLLPQMMMQLAHTHPGPDINLDKLLHGHRHAIPEVTLVYRSEFTTKMLSNKAGRDKSIEWLKMARRSPHIMELFNIPLYYLITAKAKTDVGDIEDIEEPNKEIPVDDAWYIRHNGTEYEAIKSYQIKTGDVLFVPCDFGHHDEFGWTESTKHKMLDVFDLNATTLRIHPRYFPQFTLPKEELTKEVIQECLLKIGKSIHKDLIGRKKIIQKINTITSTNEWYFKLTPDNKGFYCYILPNILKNKEVDLFEHSQDVSKFATNYAEKLGLPDIIKNTMYVAGQLHDLGKADPRFQARLQGVLNPIGKLLAKSAKRGGKNVHPKWRHELQSLEIIHANNLIQNDKEIDPLLLFFIVGSHHGWLRPFFPIRVDKKYPAEGFSFKWEGKELKSNTSYATYLTELGYDWFWDINKKYGIWTLAFLESVFRLADWAASKNKGNKNA